MASELAKLGNQSIGQSIGFGVSSALASEDWDRWKNSLTRGPLYRMQGLRAAGLNPILAASAGIGAGAPTVPTAKPTSGGSPGGNPALAVAQIKAANAMSAKAVEETRGTAFDNVERAQRALFWGSPLGLQTIEDGARNAALPNTLPAAGIRLLDMLRAPNAAKGLKTSPKFVPVRPKKEYQRPRGRSDPQMGLP